jgi:branched-chain amino acid transport system ATP-binding protein
MTEAIGLTVSDLHAWYGDSKALHGMNFEVRRGEIVTLLGRNGAGKTSTLRAIMGLIRKQTGAIHFGSQNISGRLPEAIAKYGIAYCPEERGIFASLTVAENLVLPPILGKGGMTLHEIYGLFPNLLDRRASPGTRLSGGEQQMLAIARILRTGATLLLLDEPTEGLAPLIVKQIGAVLRSLKDRGLTVLLVEQNFRFASRIADRHYVVENGRVIDTLAAADVADGTDRIEKYLKV